LNKRRGLQGPELAVYSRSASGSGEWRLDNCRPRATRRVRCRSSAWPIYASVADKRAEMEAAGISVTGSLDALLRQMDVVIDCSPKRVAAQNKAKYQAAGVKAIWQGVSCHLYQD
jgi:glyceraldehyde-3-phosphate dehydrogenase/erythrose-4-phosphate dehydrogenase